MLAGMLGRSRGLAAGAKNPDHRPSPPTVAMTTRAGGGRLRSLYPATPARAPEAGWHWVPWLCEYAGTALLLAGGLSAVFLDIGPHSPVAPVLPSSSARLLLTGLLFAGTGSLVALSPIGRRSGAHLNPAVTLAFWTQRKVHPHDLAGYVIAQVLGAITACALLRLAWGHTAQVLHLGATQPGHGYSSAQAAALESAMTASLVLMILLMTSSTRTARWTPLGNWLLVATLVWQGAPYTGTSLNPARSLGPALVAPLLANLWPYLVGPLAGALLAVAVFALFTGLNTLTAKLFHDPRYATTLGSDLPTATTGRDPATGSTSTGSTSRR
jgi:aquaporin Z